MSVLKNKCGISPPWVPGGGTARPPVVEFGAIWDTGATNSVITEAVVTACGLAPTGMAQVRGVHGVAQAETYLVNIALPNIVMFTSIRVTKGDIGGADILIGMDVIGMGDFSVTNAQGTTKFSYRTPSIEHVDYVEVHNKLFAKKTAPVTRAERRREKFGR